MKLPMVSSRPAAVSAPRQETTDQLPCEAPGSAAADEPGKDMRVHIKQGFQQGMAVRNREKQKTEADRDRTSKKACDEQPAGDQLYKRNPQAQ